MPRRQGDTETITISLPREMRTKVEQLRQQEHRTTSELFREALRVYARSRGTYTPTRAEHRAIARGRASESIPLEEAPAYVDRLRKKGRAQESRSRSRRRG